MGTNAVKLDAFFPASGDAEQSLASGEPPHKMQRLSAQPLEPQQLGMPQQQPQQVDDEAMGEATETALAAGTDAMPSTQTGAAKVICARPAKYDSNN